MQASKSMKLYSEDGVEMMEVKSVDLEGDVLVINGKVEMRLLGLLLK